MRGRRVQSTFLDPGRSFDGGVSVYVLEGRPVRVGESWFLPGAVPPSLQPDPRLDYRWRKARRATLHRDQGTCQACGGPAAEVDHITELVDGGAPFDPTNLRSICGACHRRKSDAARQRRILGVQEKVGSITVCPGCNGVGACSVCSRVPHPCSFCLGTRLFPVRDLPSGLPAASLLALLGDSALWGVRTSRDKRE